MLLLCLVSTLGVTCPVVLGVQDDAEAHAEAEGEHSAADSDHAEADHDAGEADDHHGAADTHGEGAHGEDAHAEDHGGHATGVPLNFQSDLALWSLITFIIFLFVMKKMAWGPMISGLDKREAGIRAAIAEAEENQRKSAALLAEYQSKLKAAEQTVAEMVAEAKRDADRTSQDIITKAQSEVDALRKRATEDISRAKDAALAEVFSSVNAQVAAATERVLGRALSDDDQDRLIQEALSEIAG
jgi:F-type H+-transporting ATPase subunit b